MYSITKIWRNFRLLQKKGIKVRNNQTNKAKKAKFFFSLFVTDFFLFLVNNNYNSSSHLRYQLITAIRDTHGVGFLFVFPLIRRRRLRRELTKKHAHNNRFDWQIQKSKVARMKISYTYVFRARKLLLQASTFQIPISFCTF